MRNLLMLTALMAGFTSSSLAACPDGYSPERHYVRGDTTLTLFDRDDAAISISDAAGTLTCSLDWVETDMSVGLTTCNGTESPIVFDNGAAEFAGKIYQRKCP